MRKFLLVALPLASLAFLAGCCNDDTCRLAASAPTVKAGPKLAAADYKPGSVLTEEQWDALVAADKAGVETPEVEVAQKVEEKAPAKPIVSSTMPTIPTMPLPKGWNYVGEQDLADGMLNTVAIDELYTQTEKPSNKG